MIGATIDKGRPLRDALPLDTVVRASKTQVACTLGGEVMILNLENGVYYGLDPVGARIWELLQEPRTILEIRDALLQEFEVEPERCEKDLLGLIDAMMEARLVELGPETAGE